DEGEGALELNERVGDLLDLAERQPLREITRRLYEVREHHGRLARPVLREPDNPRPDHDCPEIGEYSGKAIREHVKFARFAAVEGDAFRVLAQAHEAEAEIRLEALLREIEVDQRPTQPDGEPG